MRGTAAPPDGDIKVIISICLATIMRFYCAACSASRVCGVCVCVCYQHARIGRYVLPVILQLVRKVVPPPPGPGYAQQRPGTDFPHCLPGLLIFLPATDLPGTAERRETARQEGSTSETS